MSTVHESRPLPVEEAPLVIKVGGNDLDNPDFCSGLARLVAGLASRPVLVHGGGKGTTALGERLGLESRFVDGLRVTDEAALDVAVMGLVGTASIRLVQALTAARVPALGLAGADARLVIVEKLEHPDGDLGRVGRPTRVDAPALLRLVQAGFVPCLAPVCCSDEGLLYNVNADHVAQAVATALDTSALVYLTNVPGVLVAGALVPRLCPSEVEARVAEGHIRGGMIPKVRAATEAVRAGARRVLITNLEGLEAWLRGERAGTEIIPATRAEAAPEDASPLGDGFIAGLDQDHVVGTYKRAPILFVRGEGVHLHDAGGHRYLDFLAGIAVNVLGYGDPEVLAAIQDQAGRLMHVSNLFHTEPQALLARDLCESSFADRVFFCNSGTEANEGAIKFARKLARKRTGGNRHELVAFSDAFHGRTCGALAITHNAKYREPFEPLVGGVRWATFNDLASAAEVIGENTAAVIVEPIQGEGGVRPATPEFLRGLRELCDARGAALVFDEVQCGLGRTGHLWAYERYGVTPDIMTLAKPLGSGLPIGAILVCQAVADALEPGDHGSTFAANPVITSVARVVLERVRRPGFLEQVADVGAYLAEGLRRLVPAEAVVEVRGCGLMWGVELVSGIPAADVVAAGYRRGIVVGSAGHNTLRMVPPLVIERVHVDLFLAALQESLDAVRDALTTAAAKGTPQ